jgi:sugar phosphate isomerase/epimerase
VTVPVAVQLYSVRADLEKDFAAGIRRIAAMGYAGVETAGFPGTTAKEAAKLFRELGLQVPSMHAPLHQDEKRTEILEAAEAVGCKYIICAYLPPENFKTADEIKKNCDKLNEANAVARQHGFTFGYHNHWWEYQPMGDSYPAEVMLRYLDPTMVLELDTYWIKTAGQDPAQIVKKLGNRAPLLHIKDGPAVRDQPMVAVGEGVMDVPGIVKAGADCTEWLVVELDACATDMMEAVQKSYRYLVDKGLGHGR